MLGGGHLQILNSPIYQYTLLVCPLLYALCSANELQTLRALRKCGNAGRLHWMRGRHRYLWTQSCREQTSANSRDLHGCTGAKTADFAKKCWRVSRNVNIESPSSNNIGVIISVLIAINWFWSFFGRTLFISEKIYMLLLWRAPWDFSLAPQKKAWQWQWHWKKYIKDKCVKKGGMFE